MTEENLGRQSRPRQGSGITAMLLIAALLTGYCVAKDCERPSLTASHVAAVQSVPYTPTAGFSAPNRGAWPT